MGLFDKLLNKQEPVAEPEVKMPAVLMHYYKVVELGKADAFYSNKTTLTGEVVASKKVYTGKGFHSGNFYSQVKPFGIETRPWGMLCFHAVKLKELKGTALSSFLCMNPECIL
jgi:hypothetical protein